MVDIIRVFASKTSMCPVDENAYFDEPPMWINHVDEPVHVSVSFSWDIPRAEYLAKQWERVSDNVVIGGPAMGSPANEFIPGMYLKAGAIMTSRGCPKKCGHCLVPQREGRILELGIHPGSVILDNNLMACSRQHIEKVFSMLKTQKNIQFSGGVDVDFLKPWHVDLMRGMSVGQIFIAYDRQDNIKAVDRGLKLLQAFPKYKIRCYILVGYKGDTIDAAEERCQSIWNMGAMPFAMLYRDPESGNRTLGRGWSAFVKTWIRPPLMKKHMEKIQ